MDYFFSVLKKYTVFTGRARRMEYWMFVLISIVISFVLGLIDGALGLQIGNSGVLGLIFSLGILIPSIAVAIRRLHDTGRSGWWILINIIPFLGWLVFIIFMFLDGEKGTNKYGPAPKEHKHA